jgi:small conductance mechanosensitive channel
MAAFDDLVTWLSGRGLEVVLIILGSVLLARFVAWVGRRITDRIDARATGGDALVRSEAAKHRHSLTQVLTWAAIVLIYSIAVFFVLDRLGVPVTGLVAPATVLGVGLGFGAQRIVGDVLAGFFIITERQYGFGDVVSIQVVGGGDPAEGTVEDVTLRVTRVRSANGEVITVPNGQIVKVINLSRDWARAVIDVPVPTSVDVNRVNEILREVGREAFRDPALRPLLLDPPSVMGVESLGLEEVNVRVVARTLPGKQFEVGRDLRARVVLAFGRQGVAVQPPPVSVDTTVGAPSGGPPSADGAARDVDR